MQPKIATICYPFMGRTLGGSHISALGLIIRLDPARFRPCVVVQHLCGPIFELFRDNGVVPIRAPSAPDFQPGVRPPLDEALRLAASSVANARLIRSQGASIAHTNDGRTNLVWGPAARMAGAKVIWHSRGSPNAAGLRFIAPLIADQVLSVSAFASPRPGLWSTAGRNEVVYSPFDIELNVDRSLMRAKLADELSAPSNAAFVGYFGHLIHRKRPVLFVDAIAALQRLLPERSVYGVFFGVAEPKAESEVRERAQALGVLSSIAMMGYRVPGADWIAACDLLLVPAVDEPFGRTLPEAMLVKTPIVAARSGGNIEAIRDGHTGLLATPDDAEALAAAAARILADDNLGRSIANAAQEHARTRFGMDKHADHVMRVYDRVLGRQ